MYLISLYFDEKTNRTLQRLIDKIADHTGNAFMTEHNVPPHMTISSIEARNPEVLIPAFSGLFSNRQNLQFHSQTSLFVEMKTTIKQTSKTQNEKIHSESIQSKNIQSESTQPESIQSTSTRFESIQSENTQSENICPGTIQIVTVGQLFPYVFYCAPVLNRYLQEMSETIYDAFKDIPETTISKLYRPYQWMPHITLGKTLDKEQMQQAFLVAQESFQPLKATVTEIGLAKTNPHKDIIRIRL